MAELDTGRLIRETQKLVTESKRLHESSRQSVSKSKYLERVLAVSVSACRRARRRSQYRKRHKRLLAN